MIPVVFVLRIETGSGLTYCLSSSALLFGVFINSKQFDLVMTLVVSMTCLVCRSMTQPSSTQCASCTPYAAAGLRAHGLETALACIGVMSEQA